MREANDEKWKRRATKPLGFATDARSNRLRAGRAEATKKPIKPEKSGKKLVKEEPKIKREPLFREATNKKSKRRATKPWKSPHKLKSDWVTSCAANPEFIKVYD